MLFKSLRKEIFKISKNERPNLWFLISRSLSTVSQPTTSIETVNLAYTIYDKSGKTTKKPPLVIFHGVIGTRKGWDAMAKAINLATGRRVITFDARNHGDSDHSPDLTYLHMAHDAIELLKTLELTKVSLLGHSMGGHNAMVVALTRPDLVSSLVVEEMSPIRKSERSVPILANMIDVMATARIRSDVSMTKAIELAHEHLKAASNDINVRNYLIENLVHSDTGFYTWKCNISVLKKVFLANLLDFPASLKGFQYTGPTLFLGGSLSDFIRKSDFPEIKKLFPSAELTYVDGAGHWMHSQKPKKFLEILCKFLIEQ